MSECFVVFSWEPALLMQCQLTTPGVTEHWDVVENQLPQPRGGAEASFLQKKGSCARSGWPPGGTVIRQAPTVCQIPFQTLVIQPYSRQASS